MKKNLNYHGRFTAAVVISIYDFLTITQSNVTTQLFLIDTIHS